MIVRYLALANLYYLTLILQPNMSIAGTDQTWHPWLPGIALVVGVLSCHELAGLIFAFVLGVGVDCLSIHRLGIHTMVATSLAVGLTRLTFDHKPRGMLIYGFLSFVVTFLWLVSAALIHGFLEAYKFDIAAVTVASSTSALSTAVLVQAVLLLIGILKFLVQPNGASSIVLANHWTMLNGK